MFRIKTKMKERADDIGDIVFEFVPWLEKEKIDAWVKKIAKKSKQPVGWSNHNGRIRVIGKGDLDKIRITIKMMLPQLNAEIHDFCKKQFNRNVKIFDPTFTTKIYTENDVDQWAETSLDQRFVPLIKLA